MKDEPEGVSSGPVEVPYTALTADVLAAVLESFVLREGTDYGERELPLEDKVTRLRRLLECGDAQIVYDPATDSVDIVTGGRGKMSRGTT